MITEFSIPIDPSHVIFYTGLSSDPKPGLASMPAPEFGAWFYEIDTGNRWTFDGQHWNLWDFQVSVTSISSAIGIATAANQVFQTQLLELLRMIATRLNALLLLAQQDSSVSGSDIDDGLTTDSALLV